MKDNNRIPFEISSRLQDSPAELSPHTPASWFHPIGIKKVISRLEPRMPKTKGCLFLTFTLDPELFEDEGDGFDNSRGKLRKIFYKLRKGLEYNGKTIQLTEPYCVKTEFHKNGWVHYHVVFLTQKRIPGALLNELWNLGRTNIKKVKSKKFKYLLKYVCKPGDLPEWVKKKNRIRIFQSSEGFLKPETKRVKADSKKETTAKEATTLNDSIEETGTGQSEEPTQPKKKRASCSIGERFHRWAYMAKLSIEGTVRTLYFQRPFKELLHEVQLEYAMKGQYLGNHTVQIHGIKELLLWISKS